MQQPQKPDQGVGAFIGRARRTIVEAIDQKLAPLDISHAQWIVVMLLGDGAAATAAELCKLLIYDPGAMTRLLDRLIERECRGRGHVFRAAIGELGLHNQTLPVASTG